MAVKTRDELKGRFQDGDIPTGADFTDLIDSAAQPSEIPAAPNLTPYLTSATAASTYQTQAGLAAAVDPLLPGYTFSGGISVGTETESVTPITLDNAFVQALFTTYLQSLPGYVNNNTVSLRGNMTWETAGASLVTPAAPTTPVTNDTSFGWTDTGGKTFADAEVKIGAAAYVQANGNPHTGITGAYAPGEVLVRYKAVNGVSTVSAALANTVAFTEASQGGGGTPQNLTITNWTESPAGTWNGPTDETNGIGNLTFPADTDARFYFDYAGQASVVIGLDKDNETAAAWHVPNWDYILRVGAARDFNLGGVLPTAHQSADEVLPLSGGKVGLSRIGTSLNVQYSTDGGTTWVTVHTVTGVLRNVMYLKFVEWYTGSSLVNPKLQIL